MNKLALKFSPAIFLMCLISNTAFATTDNVEESWSARPEIMSQVNLRGSHFEIQINFAVSQSEGLEKVKALFRDNSLFQKFSNWVKDARYSAPDADGTYDFGLTVGRFGKSFAHSFTCHEEQASDGAKAWKQICTQNTPTGNVVITEGTQTLECIETASASDPLHPGAQCEILISGQMLRVPGLISLSGSQVAYTFFVESTSYVAQIGFMAGNVAHTPAEAMTAFKCRDLKRMIGELKARQDDANSLGATEELTAIASSPAQYMAPSKLVMNR